MNTKLLDDVCAALYAGDVNQAVKHLSALPPLEAARDAGFIMNNVGSEQQRALMAALSKSATESVADSSVTMRAVSSTVFAICRMPKFTALYSAVRLGRHLQPHQADHLAASFAKLESDDSIRPAQGPNDAALLAEFDEATAATKRDLQLLAAHPAISRVEAALLMLHMGQIQGVNCQRAVADALVHVSSLFDKHHQLPLAELAVKSVTRLAEAHVALDAE